jgi:hypothetical protein
MVDNVQQGMDGHRPKPTKPQPGEPVLKPQIPRDPDVDSCEG